MTHTIAQLRMIRIILNHAAKSYNYIYYNGAQAIEEGAYNKQFATTCEKAVELLASRESVSKKCIMEDTNNWYYIQPISEALESVNCELQYRMNGANE
jgi:hypothetical protein